jgi:hypothetical protein
MLTKPAGLALRKTGMALIIIVVWIGSFHGSIPEAWGMTDSQDHLFPMLADYNGAIREKTPRADGIRHIDTHALIQKLTKLHVNTYFYLIWHESTDWDDLRKEFLPAAQKAGIRVFAYLVPPSEAGVKRSEPYGTDYAAWFRAIGHLSRKFPNLKGIVIDDFNHNLNVFTPEALSKIRDAGKAENPSLLFLPQVYYPAVTPAFVRKYAPLIDGLVMAFRDDRHHNTQRLDRLLEQTDRVQFLLEKYRLPLILMIYASRLSATPANPSARYIEDAVKLATVRLRLNRLQGIVTYILPKEPKTGTEERTVAASGQAYASLFAPPVQDAGETDMVEWLQRFHLEHPPPYRLSFRYFRVSPSTLPAGAFILQVLVDRTVVWQRDLKQFDPYVWHSQTADLTPALTGKRQAILSLRLIRLGPGRTGWSYAGFDQLEPYGFSLKNPDFELGGHGWATVTGSRGMLGEVIFHDPLRRERTLMAVRKHYGAFAVFHLLSIRASEPLLSLHADRLLNRILLNRPEEALEILEKMIPLILFDKGLTLKEKEKLIRISHDLYHQLNRKDE